VSACFTCGEPLFNCNCGMAQDCPHDDFVLDEMSDSCGEERPADEGVTHGEKFRLVPRTILHGKRCFVYCGDDHCNCDAGIRAGDQISIVARRGGKSRIAEMLRKMHEGVLFGPVEDDGSQKVYWDGACRGRLMPIVGGTE